MAVGDYATGSAHGFFAFYLAPVALVAWHFGWWPGLSASLLSATLWVGIDLRTRQEDWNLGVSVWNTSMRLVAFALMAYWVARASRALAAERELSQRLRATLDTVHQLKGLLPICAQCKRIRNDQGDWEQIESYIHAKSEAEFSHGICPDCLRKLYPELAEEVLAETSRKEKPEDP